MPPTAEDFVPLLQVRGLVKTFPGVRALDGVDFELRAGEIHALVGENGAGKSTLIHTLGGVLRPDRGEIRLYGKPVEIPDPHAARRLGIAVVFQELSLCGNLTVAENVFANRQPVTRWGTVDFGRLYAEAQRLLNLFELDVSPKARVAQLSPAQRQVVEILKALSQEARILILDEPTSSLTTNEVGHLFGVLRRLRAQGLSLIYISHHLPEIFELADRVTVLRDGRNVVSHGIGEVTEEVLVTEMVGRELLDLYGSPRVPGGQECFRMENGGRGTDFQDVSFSIGKGEIVGLAGLSGAGRTELARAIFGSEPLETGQMFLDGRAIRIDRPQQAIRSRISYLTEDRKEEGLFFDMTIRDNYVAPSLPCFARRLGVIDERAIDHFAEHQRSRFAVATPGIRHHVAVLSGGNQQKVLLGMWVGVQPLLLIADEPTRGVDVGAKREIYSHLRDLASQGVAILLISSELPELLGMSDRILVMRQGRLVKQFRREEATEEKIIACAVGVAGGATADNP